MADVDVMVEPWLQGCTVNPHGQHRCDGRAMVVTIMVGSTWPTSIRWLNHGCTLLMGNVDEAVATIVVIPMADIDEAVVSWL
jgi:hypothetical protein